MTDIAAIIEKLEAADGPNYAIEVEIFKLVHPEYQDFIQGRGGLIHPQDGEDVRVQSNVRPPNYTASLDAALNLHAKFLPGWTVANIGQDDRKGWHAELRKGCQTSYSTVSLAGAATPAIALCLAVMKAKRMDEVSA